MRRLMFTGQIMYKKLQGCQLIKPYLEAGSAVCMPKAVFFARPHCQVRNALKLEKKMYSFPTPWLTDTAERWVAFVYCSYIDDSKGRSRLVQVYTF